MRGPTPLANEIEVVALLTAPGQVSITTGAGRQTRAALAGLSTIRVPAVPGRVEAALVRGGRTVASARSSTAIDDAPSRQDATYGGVSSTRPFVAVSEGDLYYLSTDGPPSSGSAGSAMQLSVRRVRVR